LVIFERGIRAFKHDYKSSEFARLHPSAKVSIESGTIAVRLQFLSSIKYVYNM